MALIWGALKSPQHAVYNYLFWAQKPAAISNFKSQLAVTYDL